MRKETGSIFTRSPFAYRATALCVCVLVSSLIEDGRAEKRESGLVRWSENEIQRRTE